MKRSVWFVMALAFIFYQTSYMTIWSAYTALVKGQKPMFAYPKSRDDAEVSVIHHYADDEGDSDVLDYARA